MEVDPSFKQLIPYVLLEYTTPAGEPQLFTYTRGGGSGEKRLHAKRSVGIGGHISREDAEGGSDVYATGMQRELAEEVVIKAEYTETREGLIYDPSSDVGKVHLGVVHRFVLESPHVESNEADLAEGGLSMSASCSMLLRGSKPGANSRFRHCTDDLSRQPRHDSL